MKKNIIAVLLVIALSTVAAFAVDDASFQVETSVAGINMMKLTQASFSGNKSALEGAAAYTGPLEVTASGAQTFDAYLSTLSNNRKGYTVSMTASAMASEVTGQATSYINYTVQVNGVSIETDGATTVATQTVIDQPAMPGLASQSHKISLIVDSTTFDEAVEGDYEGTVTFIYAAK